MLDVIIIGGGHNGLVAACYMGRAGIKPLVLERRGVLGGGAVVEEFSKGFRCPVLAHAGGPFSRQVADELGLRNHGFDATTNGVRLFAPALEGPSVTIYDDVARTAEVLKKVSARDAGRYVEFCESFAAIGRVLAPLLSSAPPSIEKPTASELWALGKTGKDFRALGKRDAYRLLRWGPMAVADLAAEWFETELLRAVVAARGIFGAFAGPWSAGTSIGLLMQAAISGHPLAPAPHASGMGALTIALASAARAAGAELRTNAPVERVIVREGRAAGVVLEDGEVIEARAVVSNADPRTTFLRLVEPTELDPDFLSKVQAYRSKGTAAKVNLALERLPEFKALKGNPSKKLSGRIHVGPDIDYLERAFDAAKYGDFSREPYMDITIPTLAAPTLAPEGKHVMSVYVQYAPFELREGDWETRGEEFGKTVLRTLETYAPGITDLVIDGQVITPRDLESVYGFWGGHPLHGEMSLDQFYTFRPLIGWAQYRTPIRNLYLCGAGTHPGGGITGLPGMNASREILKDLKKKK